jgi:hypothetical protein
MATAATKPAPVNHTNGGTTVIEAIDANVEAIEEAAHKSGETLTETIDANVKTIEEAAHKSGDTFNVWAHRLPLASLGLAATVYDEAEVFVDKLFMDKLVKRGELAQKHAEKWLKGMQARLR